MQEQNQSDRHDLTHTTSAARRHTTRVTRPHHRDTGSCALRSMRSGRAGSVGRCLQASERPTLRSSTRSYADPAESFVTETHHQPPVERPRSSLISGPIPSLLHVPMASFPVLPPLLYFPTSPVKYEG